MINASGFFLKIWFEKIAFFNSPLVRALLLACLLTGCEGDVSGGEQTVVSSGGPASGARLFVNNVDGNDNNDGISLPFKSLQYALDQLRPGDVLVIQSTEQDYQTDQEISDPNIDGNILRGFRLSTSGTKSAPIVIEGDITSPPTIHQGQSDFANDGSARIGLLLDCVSHVVVRNLIIRGVNEAGISSSMVGACETSNVTLDGNTIYDVYGEKYVGGIRLMGVNEVIIQNNKIRDVYTRQANEERGLIKAGSSLSNIFIGDNTFNNLDAGVVLNAQGFGSTDFYPEEAIVNIQIHNNTFKQVVRPVNFYNQINDSSGIYEIKTGLFKSVDVSGNLFLTVEESAILVELGDSEYQSESFCLFNNNFIDTDLSAIDITGVQYAEIFNNIFVRPESNILVTRSPQSSIVNSIAYSNFNLFLDVKYLTWQLDVGGMAEEDFSDLSNWQYAQSHPELSVGPDLDSSNNDPLFIDPLDDFRLSDASPALLAGRYGASIGYDYTLPLDFKSNCRMLF